MATMALTPEEKAPISQHRAFPAIVALWFAALLGFGTLLLPSILFDRAVDASGLVALIPAARPPLGSTAHLLMAAVAATLGGLLGLFVARRVVGAHHAPVRAGRTTPLNALEDLDDDAFDPAPFAFLRDPPAEAGMPVAPQDDWLDLGDPTFAHEANDDAPIEQFPTFAELERRRAQRRSEAPDAVAGSPNRRLFLRRSEDEPLTFAAPSLTHPALDNENTAREIGTDMNVDADQALAQYFQPAAIAAPVAPVPAWQSEPLEELGLVQLVERLGSSLGKRRALAAGGPAVVVPNTSPDGFDSAPPEDAAQAMAAYFAAPNADLPPEADGGEHAGADNEGEFGSLLNLRQPSQKHAEPDERLRDALATLERLSAAS
ncbi:MAG: hypothetical protein ABIT09_12275 [Croceibacterium sp.]